MNHIFLFAVAAGATLLVAQLLLGGKDTDHGGGGHHAGSDGHELGIVGGLFPFASLRFWVFLLAFGGGTGLALDALGWDEVPTTIAAAVIGWVSGAGAVAIIASISRHSTSSEVVAHELVGLTGTLMLPLAPGKPTKVRIAIKGRAEDYVAHGVDDDIALATGSSVLVVGAAEGSRGALLVAKAEM